MSQTIATVAGLRSILAALDAASKALASGKGDIRTPGALGVNQEICIALVQSAAVSESWRASVLKIALAYFTRPNESRANLAYVIRHLVKQVNYLLKRLPAEQTVATTKPAAAKPTATITAETATKRLNVVRADYARANIELTLEIAENEAPASALAKIEEAAKALPALTRKAEQARREAVEQARHDAATREAETLRGNATRLRQLHTELQTLETTLEYAQGTGGQPVTSSAKSLGFPVEGEGVVVRAIVMTMRADRKPEAMETIDRLYFSRGGRPTRGALKAFASGLVRQVEYLLNQIERHEVEASVAQQVAALLSQKPAKAVQAAAATVSTTEQLRARLERALGADAYSTRANAVKRNRAEFAAAKTDDARKAVIKRCEEFVAGKNPEQRAREVKERGQIAQDLKRLTQSAPKGFGELLTAAVTTAPQAEAAPAN